MLHCRMPVVMGLACFFPAAAWRLLPGSPATGTPRPERRATPLLAYPTRSVRAWRCPLLLGAKHTSACWLSEASLGPSWAPPVDMDPTPTFTLAVASGSAHAAQAELGCGRVWLPAQLPQPPAASGEERRGDKAVDPAQSSALWRAASGPQCSHRVPHTQSSCVVSV